MSQTQYIIEGNLVTMRRVSDEGQISLKDFLPALTAYTPIELAPLPDGLRYISAETGDNNTINVKLIVQFNPHLQRINYKDGHITADHIENTSHLIPMPFTLFWIDMTGSVSTGTRGETKIWAPKRWGALWARQPLVDLNSLTTYPFMPNCYTNSRVCFGTNQINARQSLGDYVNTLVNTFWTSEFNTDLTYPWPYRTMDLWQKAGEENPACWTNWTQVWAAEKPTKHWLDTASETTWNDPVPGAVDEPSIPTLRTLPTFSNLETWLNQLNEQQIGRMKIALAAR